MLDAIDLEDCLVELPRIGGFRMWSSRNVDSPVRDIKPLAWVQPSPLEAPDATIYGVTLADGSTREVIVGGDPRRPNFDDVCFLKEGRTSDIWEHIISLLIPPGEEAVPQSLKDAIRTYEVERSARSARLSNG